MKAFLLSLLTFLPVMAEGAVPPTSAELAYQVNKNLLQNPGYEEGVKKAWTPSNGFYGKTTDSGNTAATWQPSAIGQTYSQTVPVGRLAGNSCVAQLNYKGGDSNYVFEVTDGTNALFSRVLTSRTVFGPVAGLFTCPASGNLIYRLRSTSATPALISLDDAYLGGGPVGNIPAQLSAFVTEWREYPLTIGANGGTAPTKGTVIFDKAMWRRVGPDSIEVRYDYQQSAGGTAGTGTYLFPIPPQFSIDSSKQGLSANRFYMVGTGKASNNANGGDSVTRQVQVFAPDAQNLTIASVTPGSDLITAVGSGSLALTGSINYSFRATIPVAQYANAQAGAILTKDPFTWLSSKLTTRVTVTPSKVGEYRTYAKQANAYTYTDSAPSIAPTSANGLYAAGVAYASAGTAGDNRHEIFVEDCNKIGKVIGFNGINRAGAYDAAHFFIGTNAEYGAAVNCGNNILTIDFGASDGGVTGRRIGYSVPTGGGSASSANTGYYDVQVFDNPTAAGYTLSDNEAVLSQGAGYGSTNASVRRYANLVSKGDAITCTQSATLGDSCTINVEGDYYIGAGDKGVNAVPIVGLVTKNATGAGLTTVNGPPVRPFALSTEVIADNSGQINRSHVSLTTKLLKGDVIRWQEINSQNGSSEAIPSLIALRIKKLPTPFDVSGGSSASLYSGGGSERIERVTVAGGTTPTVSSQSGSWVSSISRTSTGFIVLNLNAGVFGAAPTCSCNVVGSSTNYAGCNFQPTPTVSAVGILTQTTGGVGTDLNVSVICMGPRGTN